MDFDIITLGRYRRRMIQIYRQYAELCEDEENKYDSSFSINC